MENNEILTNDDVVDTAIEVAVDYSDSGIGKIAVGAGLGVVAGVLICVGGKHLYGWIKSKHQKKQTEKDVVEDVDFVEVDEDDDVTTE